MQLETIITLAILGVVALSGVIAIIVAIARGEVKAFIKEKIIIQKDKCISLFTEALFSIAETWKQTKCPSTNE